MIEYQFDSLPQNWKVKKLKEVVTFLDNKRIPIKESERISIKGQYPYYGASGIIGYVNDYIFNGDYILLGEDGANILSRSTPLAFKVSGKIWVNNHAHVLEPKDFMDIGFLTEFLESLSYIKYNTGTAQPKLPQSNCSKIDVILPPLPEQQKIAEILSTWDEAIEKTERLITALRTRKKGLMQRLLTGKVRFPEFVKSKIMQKTKHGEIPIDWRLVHLQEIGKVNTDCLSEDNNPEQEFFYIELSDINQGEINFLKQKKKFGTLSSRARRVPRIYDIVMSTVRPNLLGYTLIDFEPKNLIFSTGFALISPQIEGDSNFIYQSLYGDIVQRQINGLITGSNYPAINSSDVKNLELVYPKSCEERQRIGSLLRSLDNEIKTFTCYIEKLKQQKKGLMQRLLTGQVRMKLE